MEKVDWDKIRMKLQNILKKIFYNCDFENLSNYEKRKMIFEYLCNHLSYDYEMLNNIRQFHEGKKNISRNPFLELSNVIDKKIGICNAISQYYKLLLEEVGITAYCVICDDGTQVNHQLNLVYDDEQKTYSFDDITSVIVGRGIIEEYFDYDIETANFFNQGNVEIIDDKKWVILPEDYINYLVGREKSFVLTLENLPYEIFSIKSKSTLNK
ncbi:MAG: hypothetical protein PUB18_05450 [bacterium]|nr:hypothetical protein [bacterium]